MADKVPHHELHRIVANCVIYDESRRYLIAKRSPHLKIFPDKWEISGGGMSRKDYEHLPHSGPDGTWEDSVHVTLRKELIEEIGVTVGHLEYVGNCTFIRPDGVAVLGLRFTAPFVKGPVKLNTKEVVDYTWVCVEELSKYDFLGNVPMVIQRVDRILAQRELRKATGLL